MLLALFATLSLAAPQAPLDPAVEADIACVASLSAAIPQIPKEEQPAIAALVTYYVGRIDGRSPGLDLKSALTRQFAGKTQAEFNKFVQSNGERCGNEMIALGARLQALGKSLPDTAK